MRRNTRYNDTTSVLVKHEDICSIEIKVEKKLINDKPPKIQEVSIQHEELNPREKDGRHSIEGAPEEKDDLNEKDDAESAEDDETGATSNSSTDEDEASE